MHSRTTHIALSWAAVVIIMAALIFWFSANTGEQLDSGLGIISALKTALASFATGLFSHEVDVSSIGHFAEYLIFGALLFNALRYHMSPRAALLLALVVGSAYGVTDELHQRFVPQRSYDPADWAVDTVATLCGAVLCARATRNHPATRAE